MALVTPSRVTITDVNTELEIAASTRTTVGNTWVQNIANVPPVFISSVTIDATTFGSVQTVTAPSDAKLAIIRFWGGGGGSSSSSRFGGGGGAGFSRRIIGGIVGGSTVISCVVGLRGAPGPTGTTGGTTTVTVNSVNYTASGGFGSTNGGTGGFGNVDGLYIVTGGTGTSGTRPTRGGNAAGADSGGGLGVIGGAGQTPGAGGGTSLAGVANFGGNGRVIIDWYRENTIRFSQLRWGINFPGRFLYLNNSTTINNNTTYSTSNTTRLSSFGQSAGQIGGFLSTNNFIQLTSAGTLRYRVNTRIGAAGTNLDYTKTWLTSGLNSDYTANLFLISGSVAGSPTNTDLSLSSTRLWYSYHQSDGIPGVKIATGELIIKNDGIQLIRRPFIIINDPNWTVLP